jgi:hypothetical protein
MPHAAIQADQFLTRARDDPVNRRPRPWDVKGFCVRERREAVDERAPRPCAQSAGTNAPGTARSPRPADLTPASAPRAPRP